MALVEGSHLVLHPEIEREAVRISDGVARSSRVTPPSRPPYASCMLGGSMEESE
jgi:hypothetical protein